MKSTILTLSFLVSALSLTSCGQSKIFRACENGDSVAVARILENDASQANATMTFGIMVPLGLARSAGVTSALIAHGANVNYVLPSGESVIHKIAKGDDTSADMLRILIEHGADVNTRTTSAFASMTVAQLSDGLNVTPWQAEGQTPLHVLALLHRVSYIVLQNYHMESNPNAIDPSLHIAQPMYDNGTTPLASGLPHSLHNVNGSDTACASVLITKGADINATDNNGNTPLHLACMTVQTRLAEMLINHGANVNAKDIGASTPLGVCKASGSTLDKTELIAFLRQYGATE